MHLYVRLCGHAPLLMAMECYLTDGISYSNLVSLMIIHACNQHFGGSTGYGHDEVGGREALDQAFAEIVGAESAIVRSQVIPLILVL